MNISLLGTFLPVVAAWSVSYVPIKDVRYHGRDPPSLPNYSFKTFSSGSSRNLRNGRRVRRCAATEREKEEEEGVEPVAAEGDHDSSLLAGKALQALEFWNSRRPSPQLAPSEVVGLLMAALQKNDQPEADDGLRTVFEFSSGMCRQAVGGTVDRFVKEAKFSVFAATVGCESFTLDPLQTVGDRFATQVVNVVASDGRRRRFLWTLERQRRPPDSGKWLIYGVVSSDVNGKLTMEG